MQLSNAQTVAMLLVVARRRLKQAVGARVRPYGLSAPQFWILVGIAEQEKGPFRELATRLRLDPPTASRLVATLTRRGLVRSGPDPVDRRRLRLGLTAKGAALASRLLPMAREMREAAVAGLTGSERETLRSLLRRVIDNLDDVESPARAKNGVARRKSA